MDFEGKRISTLDGWRGMAILLVLAGHFSPIRPLGAFGVELFFVLSGRLMAGILVGQKQPLRTFARRRAFRILPALSIYVALISCAALLGNVPTGKLVRSATAAVLFFSNYLIGGDILTVFQHTWSLAVEEHSYMFLAVLVLFAGRSGDRVGRLTLGLAILLMTVAAMRWFSGNNAWLYLHTESRAASILVSFGIATQASRIVQRLPRSILPWLAPLALGGAMSLWLLQVPAPVTYTLGTVLLAIAVNVVEHSHNSVLRIFGDPGVRWFGIVSFSLYLWQQPFYEAHATGTSALVAVPAALLFGVASYYLVEVPSRHLLRRTGRRTTGLTGPIAHHPG